MLLSIETDVVVIVVGCGEVVCRAIGVRVSIKVLKVVLV